MYGKSYPARQDAVPLEPLELPLLEQTFETTQLRGVIERHAGKPMLTRGIRNPCGVIGRDEQVVELRVRASSSYCAAVVVRVEQRRRGRMRGGEERAI